MSWQPVGQPVRYPHEYLRRDTAKLLTLFHPMTGEVRVKGVTESSNAVLHPWLKQELAVIVAGLPPLATVMNPATEQVHWVHWQEGLSIRFSLLED